MTLDDFLSDIRERVAALERAVNMPDDSLLWLCAKDVETTARHMARLIARQERAREPKHSPARREGGA